MQCDIKLEAKNINSEDVDLSISQMSKQLEIQEKKLKELELKLQQELIAKANLQLDFEHVIEQLALLNKDNILMMPATNSIV